MTSGDQIFTRLLSPVNLHVELRTDGPHDPKTIEEVSINALLWHLSTPRIWSSKRNFLDSLLVGKSFVKRQVVRHFRIFNVAATLHEHDADVLALALVRLCDLLQLAIATADLPSRTLKTRRCLNLLLDLREVVWDPAQRHQIYVSVLHRWIGLLCLDVEAD